MFYSPIISRNDYVVLRHRFRHFSLEVLNQSPSQSDAWLTRLLPVDATAYLSPNVRQMFAYRIPLINMEPPTPLVEAAVWLNSMYPREQMLPTKVAAWRAMQAQDFLRGTELQGRYHTLAGLVYTAATWNAVVPRTELKLWVLEILFHRLSAPRTEYREYMRQTRQDYSTMSGAVYRELRKRWVLDTQDFFIKGPCLDQHKHLREAGKENLEFEMSELLADIS